MNLIIRKMRHKGITFDIDTKQYFFLILGLAFALFIGVVTLHSSIWGIVIAFIPVLGILFFDNRLIEAVLILLLLSCVFVNELFIIPGLFSRISFPMIIIPPLLVVWGFKQIYSKFRVNSGTFQKEDLWFLIFISISLLASLHAWVNEYGGRIYFKDYILGITLYICCYGAYFLAYHTIAIEKVNEIRWHKGFMFIGIIMLSSLPVFCATFYSYFQQGFPNITYETRIDPPFAIHSTYFIIQLFLSLGLFWAFNRMKWKFLFLGLAFFNCFALYICFQRAALVGAFGGLITFFFYKNKKLSLALIFIGLIAFFTCSNLSKSVTNIYEQGIKESRVSLWQDALHLIRERPLTGVGVGGYGFVTHSPIAKSLTYSAHNIYLDLAVDCGIPGLISFILFLFFLWRKLLNQYYSSKVKFISNLTLGFISAFVAISIASLFGDFILPELSNIGYRGIRGVIYFWITLGIIMSMNKGNNKIWRMK